MLIRFTVKNVLSFGEETEFNMLPSQERSHAHHKYTANKEVDVLKMAAIYGANAAGKSNLVKALNMFLEINIKGLKLGYKDTSFKGNSETRKLPQEYILEFMLHQKIYEYEIKLLRGQIIYEGLHKIIVTSGEKNLIFKRTNNNSLPNVEFSSKVGSNFEKNIRSLYSMNNMLENITILKLANILSAAFNNQELDNVYNFLSTQIIPIFPSTLPSDFLINFETDIAKQDFANEFLSSLSTGITKITSTDVLLEKYFADTTLLRQYIQKIEDSEDNVTVVNIRDISYLAFKKDGDYFVKELQIYQKGFYKSFKRNELSDGTNRLIDFIALFWNLSNAKHPKTYIIDEIERSLHPNLIKELLRKFSEDTKSTGQLIFTTHESNLLDQDLFRRDEIWFAEKDERGMTHLYSLSDYHVHNTIDIQKGYLQGRYGAVPFLGDFETLNWHGEKVHE